MTVEEATQIHHEIAPTPSNPASPVGLPWLTRRPGPNQAAAAVLLLPALRRIAALPTSDLSGKDMEALDRVRASRTRLAAAASWHAAHPQGPRPMIHYLPHAAYVIRGCGLSPYRLNTLRCILGLPRDLAEEALWQWAHLTAVDHFEVCDIDWLSREHRWELADLHAWAVAGYGSAHLAACADAGFTYAELRAFARAGTIPDPGQVATLHALRSLAG